MTKRMLVDASHAEETRVVVLDGSRLEELDFEIAARRQLKGNIYLAKVTRVEPSLQAAFVEYGGNRHGFLAFSEIHPDYYRIPVADREALVADQALRSAPLDEDGEAEEKAEARPPRRGRRRRSRAAVEEEAPPPADESESEGESEAAAEPAESDPADDESRDGDSDDTAETADTSEDTSDDTPDEAEDDSDEAPETVGGDDVDEAAQRRPAPPRRHYKIQEVIKRRQIMLIQVTKEERGNKGAALTTYLSLAGRYCVLMPNTPRGGGISRKISNPKERKRMKAILDQMEVPDGMAVILRTAGLERTKAEIKRDLDYLSRLWESIRELTLKSTAPALIHEEANLIKRAERDLYSKEMEEIVVAGEDGYRAAKDFMRMLMPSHAKKVKPYRDEAIPLFHRYQVESQIDAMHSPVVQLRSGGYVVISPTEALVAIDVNSGRSTRERNIEETAYRTNLEAADEVARQLRLRDLAGLIVIDFIDMDDDRHNAAVERRLKEAMRSDRARIQVGRISAFGLLELSRQRLRPSLTETHFDICHTCGGSGLLRSVGSSALRVLRAVEEEALKRRAAAFTVRLPADVALYVLNQKRDALAELEQRRGIRVWVERDDSLVRPDFGLERVTVSDDDTARPAVDFAAIMANADAALLDDADDDREPETEAEEESTGRSRAKRTRRPRRRSDGGAETRSTPEGEEAEDAGSEAVEAADADGEARDDAQKKKRRRGKRGGRRRSATRTATEEGGEADADTADGEEAPAVSMTAPDAPEEDEAADPWTVVATAPEIGQADEPPEAWPTEEATPIAAAPPLPAEEAPSDAAPDTDGDGDEIAADSDAADDPDTANDESSGSPRKGWWQRLI